jgi:RNA polymerase sigma factor (sigma-70 family)
MSLVSDAPAGVADVAAVAPGPADPVEILRHIYPPLLATARRLTGSLPQDARDLVQDTLVEMLIRHPNFEGIDRPLGYARTVLFRRAYAGRRRAGREVPLDVLEHLERQAHRDHQDDVAARLATDGALKSLGRRQRACLYLRFVEGLDTREIAAILGCGESTVRSQMARGLRRVRATLEESADRSFSDTDPSPNGRSER